MSEKTLQLKYSPEFQMELFGLDPKDVMEPVLDVSCGQDPQLVHYLRMQGLKAYGVDYDAPELSYTKKASWTNSNFGHNKWGTILSNIDVAQTINRAVADNSPALKGLSLAYYNLLGCLKKGGSFIYAPSVPALEAQLSESMFNVEHTALADGIERTKITKLVDIEED